MNGEDRRVREGNNKLNIDISVMKVFQVIFFSLVVFVFFVSLSCNLEGDCMVACGCNQLADSVFLDSNSNVSSYTDGKMTKQECKELMEQMKGDRDSCECSYEWRFW
jgi:hypothetical protein